MLAIRHSPRRREATCAHPMGLSGETHGCTEVESELQMGEEGERRMKPIEVEGTPTVQSHREMADISLLFWLQTTLGCTSAVVSIRFFKKSQLITLNYFNSPLRQQFSNMYSFKAALGLLLIWILLGDIPVHFLCPTAADSASRFVQQKWIYLL